MGRIGIGIDQRDPFLLRSGHLGLEPLDLVPSDCSDNPRKARKAKKKPALKTLSK